MSLTDGRGRAASAPGLAAWLRRVAPRNAPREVTIALVTDARIRSLNKTYRRKDAVTDVLSFEPADIAIATGRARRQARDAGHAYGQELKILALHGLLHLIGYDHDDPADRGRMGRLERRLRAKGRLYEGLIERVERASAASKPRKRSAPATRRASARVGESDGRSPSGKK